MSMDIEKLSRLALAARNCGLKRSTLQSAIDRGELACYYSKCGLGLVREDEVKAWAKIERKPGRKK